MGMHRQWRSSHVETGSDNFRLRATRPGGEFLRTFNTESSVSEKTLFSTVSANDYSRTPRRPVVKEFKGSPEKGYRNRKTNF